MDGWIGGWVDGWMGGWIPVMILRRKGLREVPHVVISATGFPRSAIPPNASRPANTSTSAGLILSWYFDCLIASTFKS